MRRIILVLMIIFMVVPGRLKAQNSNLDKLNAYKIAFFTRRLNFTSNEAEKFWPVYNDYQAERNKVMADRNSIMRDFNQNESEYNDAKISELGDKLLATIVKESALSEKFHNQLKSILPPAKVIRFYQVENQYKTQLLKELQGLNQKQRLGPGRDL